MRQVGFDPARRLDEVDRVVVVLLDAGRDGEDVRIENDVLRREADLVHEQVGRRARRCRIFSLERVGLALLVERHHHDRRAVAPHQLAPAARNFSSPSFSEIEFTIPLPCRHFSPASITSTSRSRP